MKKRVKVTANTKRKNYIFHKRDLRSSSQPTYNVLKAQRKKRHITIKVKERKRSLKKHRKEEPGIKLTEEQKRK